MADAAAAPRLPEFAQIHAAPTCAALIPLVANGYAALVNDLGSARRSDTDAIDAALQRLGAQVNPKVVLSVFAAKLRTL